MEFHCCDSAKNSSVQKKTGEGSRGFFISVKRYLSSSHDAIANILKKEESAFTTTLHLPALEEISQRDLVGQEALSGQVWRRC